MSTWIIVFAVAFTIGRWFLKKRNQRALFDVSRFEAQQRLPPATTLHGKRYRIEKVIVASAEGDLAAREEDPGSRPDPHRLVVTIEDAFPPWVRFGWSRSAHASADDRNELWMDILFADASEELIVDNAVIYSDNGALVFETAVGREVDGTESFLLFAGAYLQKKLDLIAELAKYAETAQGERALIALRILAEHHPQDERTLRAIEIAKSARDPEVRATALAFSDYAESRAALITFTEQQTWAPAAEIAVRAMIKNRDHAALLEIPRLVSTRVAPEYLEHIASTRDPRAEAIIIPYLPTPARKSAARALSRLGGLDALAALRKERAKRLDDAEENAIDAAIETIEDRLRALHGDTSGGLSMVESGPEGGLSFPTAERGALSVRKDTPADGDD